MRHVGKIIASSRECISDGGPAKTVEKIGGKHGAQYAQHCYFRYLTTDISCRLMSQILLRSR